MSLRRVSPGRPHAGVRRLLVLPTLLVLPALLALVVPLGLGTLPGRAAGAPPSSLDEQALAVASPSAVYLETVFTGYLRNRQTGQPVLASPVTYHRRCSGFVVNPDGYAVTTRICVAPPEPTIVQQALYVAGFMLVGEKQLDRAQLDAWVAARLAGTVFTGLTDGSKPEQHLFGQLNIATGALTAAPAIAGTVTKVADLANVALVKLDQANLPAVEVAGAAGLSVGSQLDALGFATTDADDRIGTYTLDPRSVQLVGTGKLGSATYYRLSQAVGTYFHGGMAVDASGRVVGILDEDPTLPNNTNRAVYPASTITTLLSSAGVANSLGSPDRQYRAGLDDYFGGRYARAVDELDRTARQVPTNHLAAVYRQHAADRRALQGDGGPGWLLPVVAGIGGALLATVVIVLVLLVRRRRARLDLVPLPDPFAARVPGVDPFAAPRSGPPFSSPPDFDPPSSGPPYTVPSPGSSYPPAPSFAPPAEEPVNPEWAAWQPASHLADYPARPHGEPSQPPVPEIPPDHDAEQEPAEETTARVLPAQRSPAAPPYPADPPQSSPVSEEWRGPWTVPPAQR